ncbi:hypothetical protein C0993_003936 [Termitomyces sp. T159_Od127]|nr:hypothetical protein C0993_003936 [Termitomyces sp. T159_Od127]
MFSITREFLIPPARQGPLSAVTRLGTIIHRLAFTASLWTVLLAALSPTPKPTTLFATHPPSPTPSLFPTPPTPPRRAIKATKPPRHNYQPASAPPPPTIALFACLGTSPPPTPPQPH